MKSFLQGLASLAILLAVSAVAVAAIGQAILHPALLAVAAGLAVFALYAWGFWAAWDWATARDWPLHARIAGALVGLAWTPFLLAARTRSPIPARGMHDGPA